MIILVTSILASLIQNIVLFYQIHHFSTPPIPIFENKRRTILTFIIFSAYMYLIQTNTEQLYPAFAMFLAVFSYTVASMILFRTNFKDTIIAVVFSYTMLTFFQIISLCGVFLIWPNYDINTNDAISLFVVLIYALQTWVVTRFLPVRTLYKKACKTSLFIVLSCIFLYIILSFACFFCQRTDISPTFLFIVSSLAFCVLFIALCIYFFHTQNKEQAIGYYEKYLSILNDMILTIRKTQHNHNNTIQAIAGLSETYSDYDSLAAALENYSLQVAKNAIPAQLLHFDNKLLTALLYNKFCLAQENGITMDITVHNYFYTSRLNEFQIVELTGILLDNAIEAFTEQSNILDNFSNNIIVEIGAPVSQYEENTKNGNPPFRITVKNPGPEATPDLSNRFFQTDTPVKPQILKTMDWDWHTLRL